MQSSSGLLHTSDRQAERTLAHLSLAPLGTCWRVGTLACMMSDTDGRLETTTWEADGTDIESGMLFIAWYTHAYDEVIYSRREKNFFMCVMSRALYLP